MRQITLFILLGVIASNLCAATLTADQIDMSPAISNVTVIIVAIVSLLISIMGGRKVLSLLGY